MSSLRNLNVCFSRGSNKSIIHNEIREIQAFTLTRGNVVHRKLVPSLTKNLTGLLFAEKSYIRKELLEKLFDRGLKLVTKVKKGMKSVWMERHIKKNM